MRATTRRVSLTTAIVCALIVSLAAPAGAYHRDRQRELDKLISRKQRQIAAAQELQSDLLGMIAASDSRRRALEGQILTLDEQLRIKRARVAVLDARVTAVTRDLNAKSAELAGTLRTLREQREELSARVARLYMTAPTGISTALASVSNFADVVDASEYTANIVRHDLELVAAIEVAKTALEAQRAQIDAQRAAVAADRAEAKAAVASVAALRSQRANSATRVRNEIAYRNRMLVKVRSQEDAYRKALRSYRDESERIAAFLRNSQRGQYVQQGVGGWLKWPVSGPITSDYGWRVHPVYGYRSFHTGIDIGAPSGRAVRSARHGKVVYTGWNGAYGLVVMIDHGGSIATMYAHLSKIYVHEGDTVGTLSKIAAVGSTGWSTGPHLHFEVRRSGQPVNPMKWL